MSPMETGRRSFTEYDSRRRAHWDAVARRFGARRGWSAAYHQRLERIFRHLVPRGQTVLEIGCAQGDLLAALEPRLGIGVDFSPEMIRLARQRHPQFTFVQCDAHALALTGAQAFDTIILSDLLNDLWDVEAVLREAARLAHPRTRLLINSYSRLWEPALALADRLGLAKPTLYQNWLTVQDIRNLLYLADFEVIRSWPEILWPLPTPLLGAFLNTFLAKIWPFHVLCLTNMLMARAAPRGRPASAPPTISVIVPARNEAGNIPAILAQTPEMGAGTELVFVEGHSHDRTYEAIQAAIAAAPHRRCRLLRQPGAGKGDAVRFGFAHAQGDVVMILDADLTVPPQQLPAFYDVLQSGKGELANGVRLVYPMEHQAMRLLNLVGNKLFGQAFSWLLGQPVKDTLCGTKALWRADYERLAAVRDELGALDPFGDFDLLLGASRLGLKIVDVPVRYRERTYGTTNIHRWAHGLLLMRMLLVAARRLKFV